MKKMLKIIVMLFVVAAVVSAAGCASKKTANTSTTSSVASEGGNQSEAAASVAANTSVNDNNLTTANVTDNVNDPILPTSSEAEKPQYKNSQEELKAMKPFIDPELKNLNITTSDPEIKIVRLELVDNRDYKESEDWGIKVLVSNEGNNPFYVSDKLLLADYLSGVTITSMLLESGDRRWLYISPQKTAGDKFDFYHMPNLFVVSCETVMPEVSPEFKNFNKHISVFGWGPKNYKTSSIDLHSVKYVITNETKGWRSVFLEVSTKEDTNKSIIITLFKQGIGDFKNIYAYVSTGNITKIEVPLTKEETPEDITGIKLRNNY